MASNDMTTKKLLSTDFPRLKEIDRQVHEQSDQELLAWIEENPGYFDGIKERQSILKYRRLRKEALEAGCMALWVLEGGETEEWNGTACDCELIQGTYNCKLNPF